MTRKIAVITGTRADYGLLHWIMKAIKESDRLKLKLIATGMHLSPLFGSTYKEIENDGFHIDKKVEMLLASDSPSSVSKSIGLGVLGFAQAYEELAPDMVVALGDRFETFAAVSAAIPFNIPVAHFHGGETTEGAMDEQIRHAITKMSHLHFASTAQYAANIEKMGEEPWRVFNVGAPGLEWLKHIDFVTAEELQEMFGFDFKKGVAIATFHPATLEQGRTKEYIGEVLKAVIKSGIQTIFTGSNADPSGYIINEKIIEAAGKHGNIKFVDSLGQRVYLSCQKHCRMMIGNSSSGIIEAASFGLPVVNIGNRQKGRLQSGNVINVDCTCGDILKGIERAGTAAFREKCGKTVNIYGDGDVSRRVVEVLESIDYKKLLNKRLNYEGSPV